MFAGDTTTHAAEAALSFDHLIGSTEGLVIVSNVLVCLTAMVLSYITYRVATNEERRQSNEDRRSAERIAVEDHRHEERMTELTRVTRPIVRVVKIPATVATTTPSAVPVPEVGPS